MKGSSPETTEENNRTNTSHHQRKPKESQSIQHSPYTHLIHTTRYTHTKVRNTVTEKDVIYVEAACNST